MKTVSDIIERAEALNLLSNGIKISIEIEDFPDMEECFKLSDQQAGTHFEPNGVVNNLWCCFDLGDIKVIVNGKKMTDREIKQYFINQIQ